MLEILNVRKSWRSRYGVTPVLFDFSITLPSYGRIVLVGPSGGGKSTLLATIAGIIKLDSGSITLNGENDWRNNGRVTLLPQRPPLFPWLTVHQNLLEVYHLIGRRPDDASIDRTIRTFGLYPHVDKYPYELSGGWMHLVAFGMISMLSPEVVLLDEPLASVDGHRKRDLWELLDRTVYKRTKTYQIVVTHDIMEAAYIGDCIYVCTGPPLRIIEKLDRQPGVSAWEFAERIEERIRTIDG